jgi:molecular chaperone DnaK (HSP70)
LITVEKAIDEVMRKSSLQPDQIQAVLRTGGSSEVAVIIDLLTKKFGRDKVKEINPFTTVVSGLAIKAQEIRAH